MHKGILCRENRMGAGQSTDTVNGSGSNPDDVQYGFHVLRVDDHSPAHDAKLVPFFDYIIYVNGVQVVHYHISRIVSMMYIGTRVT